MKQNVVSGENIVCSEVESLFYEITRWFRK